MMYDKSKNVTVNENFVRKKELSNLLNIPQFPENPQNFSDSKKSFISFVNFKPEYMNNVYPVASDARASIRSKGAATGWEYNIPSPYETCTRLVKTITSKIAILMYVAIFSVYGQSAMAQCQSTLSGGPNTVCQGGTFSITASGGTGTSVATTFNWFEGNTQFIFNNTPIAGTTPSGGTFTYTAVGGVSTLTVNTSEQAAGTYEYRVNRNDCPTLSNPFTVNVQATPEGSTNSQNEIICRGGTASLTFMVYQQAGTTSPTPAGSGPYNMIVREIPANGSATTDFLLTFAGGQTSTTILRSPTVTTSYQIISVTGPGNCSTTGGGSNTITIANPSVNDIDGPNSVCEGNNIFLAPRGVTPGNCATFTGPGPFCNAPGAFTGATGGSECYFFQWEKAPTVGGPYTPLPGRTQPCLQINGAQVSDGGYYRLRVSDAAGGACSTTYSEAVLVTVNPYPSLTFNPSPQNPLCAEATGTTFGGTFSGTAPFTVNYTVTGPNGTTPAQTYTATSNNAAIPFTNAGTGTYTINVTSVSSAGCTNGNTFSTTVFVQQAYRFTATTVAPACAGGNGTITVDPNNPMGTQAGTVTFTLTPTTSGAGTVTRTTNSTGADQFTWNAPPGQYTITAVYRYTGAQANCTTTTTVTVGPGPSSNLAVQAQTTTAVQCGTTTIVATATGGTSTYTFQLFNAVNNTPVGGTQTATGGTTTRTTFGNVPSGDYYVRVTDRNGCTANSNPVFVRAPAPISVFATQGEPISCFGGTTTISATATGGTGSYTYRLTNGNPAEDQVNTTGNFQNVTAGNVAPQYAATYQVIVTDGSTCTATSNAVTVSQPSPVVITSTSSTPVSCNGDNDGRITVSASGGTPGGTTTTNPRYRFRLEGPAGTTGDTGWQPSSPASGTSRTFTGLLAGTYTVTARDSRSCESTSHTVIVGFPPIISGTVTSTAISCTSGTATITISNVAGGNGGPYTYSFQGPGPVTPGNGSSNQQHTVTQPGTYTVTATDNSGCQRVIGSTTVAPSANFTVTPTVQPFACNATTTTVILNTTGGTATKTFRLIGAGTGTDVTGSPVTTTGGTATFTNIPSGTYNYIVTDANGCRVESAPGSTTNPPVVVAQPTPVVLGTPVVSNNNCSGAFNTVTVSSTGGNGNITYTLAGTSSGTPVSRTSGPVANGSTYTFTNVAPGTYSVTATDTNNCSNAGTSTFTVGNSGPLTPDLALQRQATTGLGFNGPSSSQSITYQLFNLSNTSAANQVHVNVTKPTPAYTITTSDPNWQAVDLGQSVNFHYIGTPNGTVSCGAGPINLPITITRGNSRANSPNGAASVSATVRSSYVEQSPNNINNTVVTPMEAN